MDDAQIEIEIRATMRRFASGWDRHDAKAMAACWTADGNAIDQWGRYAIGRDGVSALLAGEHADPMRESTYRFISLRTNVLSPEAAVVEADCAIDHVIGPNGRPYTLLHTVNAVLRREPDAWRFVTLHPTLKKPADTGAGDHVIAD